MLTSTQKATLDALKVNVNRIFTYDRSDGNGNREAGLTLRCRIGEPVTVTGHCQTVDELEYAVARLIATARKEVSHGKAV